MIYVPANNNLCTNITGSEVKYVPGNRFIGGQSSVYLMAGADHIGEVQAWNVDTGKRAWTHEYPTSMNWGSMMTTAGRLVFTGGTNDRKIHAFDAQNGKLLWEGPLPAAGNTTPATYMVNGRQFIVIACGGGKNGAKSGGSYVAFALPTR